jgi:hypothetical protein
MPSAATRLLLPGLLSIASALVVPSAGADEAADELARKATDPTASLMSFGLNLDYTGAFHGNAPGLPGDSTGINFRPVIPFTVFGQSHILRLSLPYLVDGRGEKGLGDVTMFDLVTFNRASGRLGVGVVVTLAASDNAPDDIVVGPALGFVGPLSKQLNVGVFNQNVFGGDTAISQLQPIIAYQLGEGWSLSAGDMQLTYDWKRGRWLSLPLSLQLGKVTKIGSQPVRWSLNPQYNLADDAGLEKWSVVLGLTLLVPAGG